MTKRIVLAEDDSAMRSLLAGALRREGYAVCEAADGQELVELALDGPDLIVTDEHMPRMTGTAAARVLRARGVRCPILIVTSFGDPDVYTLAAQLGECAVLDKPVDIREFRRAVAAQL